jgi:lantibiotic modifying enzyme
MARTVAAPGGLAWPTRFRDKQALGGFAHGAGGIAWALDRLGLRTGRSTLFEAAGQGRAYQRRLLARAATTRHAAWEHPSRVEVERSMPVSMLDSWCWGATGVGLAWLRLLAATGDLSLGHDVGLALQLARTDALDDDDTSCHGTFGQIELLLEAANVLGDALCQQEAERRAAAVVDAGREHWHCSAPLEVESPGLMTGLAGIGYGLLRLAALDRVPSILTLDAPDGAPRPTPLSQSAQALRAGSSR